MGVMIDEKIAHFFNLKIFSFASFFLTQGFSGAEARHAEVRRGSHCFGAPADLESRQDCACRVEDARLSTCI